MQRQPIDELRFSRLSTATPIADHAGRCAILRPAIIPSHFPREATLMKLVRFSNNGPSPRLGLLQGDRIADVKASLAAQLAKNGVTRSQEIAAALVPTSARAFLEGGVASQEAARSLTAWGNAPAAPAPPP